MVVVICVAAAIGVTVLSVTPSWSFTDDDTFISLRYVKNLQDGHGLVYNRGERVEAYTDFLWIVMVALTDLVVGNHLLAAKVLGALFSAASLAIVLIIVSRLPVAPLRRIGLVIAVIVFFLTNVPFRIWTTGGLETSLYGFLLLLVSCVLLLRETRHGNALWAFASLALALTRPEGLAISMVVVATAALLEERRRFYSLLKWGLLAIGVYFLYRGVSYAYFGHVFPTSYLVRASGGSASDYLARRVDVGFQYVRHYFRYYLLFLPLVVIVVRLALARQLARASTEFSRRALTYAVTTVLSSIVIVIYFGGDPKVYYRLMAPLLPLVAVAFMVTISDFQKSWRPPLAADLLLVLVSGMLIYNHVVADPRRSDARSWNEFAKEHRLQFERTAAGLWVKHHTPSDAIIVAPAAGATPFFSERTSYDGCLTEYSTAERPFTVPPEQYKSYGWTAHTKSYSEDAVMRHEPCVLVGGKRTAEYTEARPFLRFWIPFSIRLGCSITPISAEQRVLYGEQAFDSLMYTRYWRDRIKADLAAK